MSADTSLQEAALTIAQVKFPHAQKAFVKSQLFNRILLSLEIPVPVSQGSGIVERDIATLFQSQGGFFTCYFFHSFKGRQASARKNIVTNKICIIKVGFVVLLLYGYSLNQGQAAWFQQV